MFHPHFLNLFFGKHSMTDTMQLISALKVEQDLRDRWRAEREQKEREEIEGNPVSRIPNKPRI